MDVQHEKAEARWNSRFLAYSRAHGRLPEAMLEHDDVAWPGGRMCGFMLWLRSQWRGWATERGGMPDILTPEHHADFDSWLGARVAGACRDGAAEWRGTRTGSGEGHERIAIEPTGSA